jgi:hypothetical protein
VIAMPPRTQLWTEEAEILSGFAASVPEHGTIVEIGTADGGTSALLQRASAGRDVTIFTVDPDPSPAAVEFHRNTGVNVVRQPSAAFAADYASAIGRPIDFLFIDGNHDLEHVVEDWNLWAPLVRHGGVVAFHDFDPRDRGGLAHLAVRIAGDTIVRLNGLGEAQHQFKLLSGRVSASAPAVSADDCLETLQAIAATVVSARDTVLRGARIAGDPRVVALVEACNGGARAHDVRGARPRVVVPRDGTHAAGVEAALVLDSLALCHVVARGLRTHYHALAAATGSHKEFIFWAETLQMLDHGCSGLTFPDHLPLRGLSLHDLSGWVAREQVRALLLARVVGTFVEWTP